MPPSRATPHFTAFRLEHPGGCSVRVPRSGLLLGRSPESDIILSDPAASQRHALLLGSAAGLQILPLGRNPTLHNGRPAIPGALLAAGDTLEVPGGRFVVRDGLGAPGELPAAWWLGFPGGERYGLPTPTCTVGGAPDDDIAHPALPPGALRFLVAQNALSVVLGAACAVNGEPREPGEAITVSPGDTFDLAGQRVHVVADEEGAGGATLAGRAPGSLAVAARFEFLPSGGRLELRFGDGVARAIDLPELRARLFAVLLAPGGGFAAGDDVPDEVLVAGVWPRSGPRDRGDLNQLVHRARRDLLGAGVDPERVLHRPRRGGSIRLLLAPGAAVRVA